MKVWLLIADSARKGNLTDVCKTKEKALEIAEDYDISKKELDELRATGQVELDEEKTGLYKLEMYGMEVQE